ncbi:hypothetical protein [Clostridium sp. AM46-21]|uniref:hypothetical protein n=1 Tax=Clostridium sp. AM46-21 TaxID=2293033 RepID=UPI00269D0BCB
MKHEPMKLTSSYNNQLYIKVMNGHFATNHSHINQYIDMTTLKVRGTMLLPLPNPWEPNIWHQPLLTRSSAWTELK